MTTLPKISVCVATYNQQKYIEECLASVLAQVVDAEVEVLVGDDCSTDSTSEVVARFAALHPNSLKPFRHQRNLGAAKNYQTLFSNATGDYIAILDGDDYWMPGKLQAQIDFLLENCNCSAVYTNAVAISDCGELIGSFNNRQPSQFDTAYLARRGNFLNFSSTMFRGEFRESILSNTDEFVDYSVHLRLSCRGSLGYINRHLAVYRVRSATSVQRHTPSKVTNLLWEAFCDPKLAGVADSDLAQGKARHFAYFAYISLKSGKLNSFYTWVIRLYNQRRQHSSTILIKGLTYFVAHMLQFGKLKHMFLLRRRNTLRVLYSR